MNKENNEERNKSINTQIHKRTNMYLCVLLCFCVFVFLCIYAFVDLS